MIIDTAARLIGAYRLSLMGTVVSIFGITVSTTIRGDWFMDFLSNLDLWAGIGRGFFCICGFYAGVQLGKWLKEQHLDKDGKVASGWKALEVVVALLGLALPICFMQVLDEAKKSQILDTQQEYCQMENSEEQCKAFQEALGGDSLGEKL